ncbi:hypothetical protein EXS74_02770 [Candidatus Woesearchaeota archaeon]|nr:hypothetical protein [Candidatus Woesearchaeota archaeon]
MAKGYSEETRKKYREIVINYLKEHPTTHTMQIRRATGIHTERIFEQGIQKCIRKQIYPALYDP